MLGVGGSSNQPPQISWTEMFFVNVGYRDSVWIESFNYILIEFLVIISFSYFHFTTLMLLNAKRGLSCGVTKLKIMGFCKEYFDRQRVDETEKY